MQTLRRSYTTEKTNEKAARWSLSSCCNSVQLHLAMFSLLSKTEQDFQKQLLWTLLIGSNQVQVSLPCVAIGKRIILSPWRQGILRMFCPRENIGTNEMVLESWHTHALLKNRSVSLTLPISRIFQTWELQQTGTYLCNREKKQQQSRTMWSQNYSADRIFSEHRVAGGKWAITGFPAVASSQILDFV